MIPSAVVILLVFRVVRQESELSERRSAEAQREALDQLRRELSARLQAIRLEEVNRLIGESGRRLPPDSPIVFVAPYDSGPHGPALGRQPHLAGAGRRNLLRIQAEGESMEFQRNDAVAAAAAYDRALEIAHTPGKCAAHCCGWAVLIATQEWLLTRNERIALHCTIAQSFADNDGIPHALYAANRLLATKSNDAEAQDYVVRQANIRQWRAPNETYMLQSLLRKISSPAAPTHSADSSSEIHDIEQITALAQNMHDHLGKLQRASRSAPGDLSWMGYGDEPWLITIVSPTSFAAPVVMAVSSRKVVPKGVALQRAQSPRTVPLGDGFLDLHVEWPEGRFAPRPGMPSPFTAPFCLSCSEPCFSRPTCCCATCIVKRKRWRCDPISSQAFHTNSRRL